MKKRILGLMIAVIFMLPVFVNAEEVDGTKFMDCVTATGSKTCKLTENIIVDEQVEIAGDIILDLNGHSITPTDTLEIKGGLLIILHGGKLTVEDTGENGTISTGENTKIYAAIQLTMSGKTDITKTATLIINAGQIEGYYYSITGNGNPDRVNTSTTINGGKLGVVNEESGVAIFQPQDGITIVNGGEISGATGIEIRSGKLEVNGGKIVGSEVPVEVTSNGSGTTSTGAGIAVSQHTTKLPINVVINDGTIQGYSALYQSNPEKNDADAIAKIKITVKGGKLEAINEGTQVLYSENNLITVEGGSFNGEISEEIAKEGTEVVEVVDAKTGDTKYVVATEEDIVETPYEEGTMTSDEFEEMLKFIEELEEDEIEEDAKEYFEETKKAITELRKLLEGKNVISAHDIYYGSFIGDDYVSNSDKAELDKAVEVVLEIPTTLEKVKEGYTRKYFVVRLHETLDDEDNYKLEVKTLDAKDNGDGTVSFESDKFSTYVLAYEDVQNVDNPKTFDGISLYIILGGLSLIGIAFVSVILKKEQKN